MESAEIQHKLLRELFTSLSFRANVHITHPVAHGHTWLTQTVPTVLQRLV